MIRSLANCWAIFFLVLKPASSIAPSFNSHSANFIKGLIKSLRTLPRFREAPGSNLSRTVKRLRATTFILAQSAVVWHWELWEVRSLSKTNLTWKIMWIFVNGYELFGKVALIKDSYSSCSCPCPNLFKLRNVSGPRVRTLLLST